MSAAAIPIRRPRRALPQSAYFLAGALVAEGFVVMLCRAPWDVIGVPVAFIALPFALLALVSLLRFGVMNAALWCIDRALGAYNDSRERQERTRKGLQESLNRNIERCGEAA